MPDFRDSLTLAETIDLVAYICSLTGGGHHDHAAAAPPREQTSGDYRVRVTYAATPPGLVRRHVSSGGHLGLFMGHEALREHWPPILDGVLARSV